MLSIIVTHGWKYAQNVNKKNNNQLFMKNSTKHNMIQILQSCVCILIIWLSDVILMLFGKSAHDLEEFLCPTYELSKQMFIIIHKMYKFDTNWSGASIASDTAEHFTEKGKMKTIVQLFMK